MAVLDPISLLYIVHAFDGLLTLFMQYVIRYSCDYWTTFEINIYIYIYDGEIYRIAFASRHL